MTDCIRVLHVFGTLGHGGAESRIIDLYRHMDRDRVQFDFVVHYEAEETGKKCPSSQELLAVRHADYFDEQVKALGGNIYAVPRFKGLNLADYQKAWGNLFEENKNTWHAVQGHMTSTAAIYLPIAKKAGIPLTVAHARSAGTDPGWKGMVTKVIRSPLQKDGACDVSLACTREAGEAVFGARRVREGKVRIVPNAIEVDAFTFDEKDRKEVRAQYAVEDCVVLGHVGRFHYAKNHAYLLHVFYELKHVTTLPVKLLLAGEGSLMERAKDEARVLGIENDVIFAGDQHDIKRFYSAFDYFVFPSRYEGLPGTVIEAQAAGLPCLVSDTVTRDVDVTTLVRHKSIGEDAALWAGAILEDLAIRTDETGEHIKMEAIAAYRAEESVRARAKLKEAGFDVATQAQMMMKFYESGRFDT